MPFRKILSSRERRPDQTTPTLHGEPPLDSRSAGGQDEKNDATDSAEKGYLKLLSQNVRGLTPAKLEEILAYMFKQNIFAVCLQETWQSETETLDQGNGLMSISHGVKREKGKRGTKGVMILLSARGKRAYERRGSIYKTYGDRVLAVKLRVVDNHGSDIDITIIVAYAPTSGHSEEEREDFFMCMGEAYADVAKGEIVVTGADMNASVGTCRTVEGHLEDDMDGVCDDAVGRYGIKHRTNTGTRLLMFCGLENLRLPISFFRKPRGAYRTWTHPRSGLPYQLDHWLINSRDAKRVIDAGTTQRLSVNSDHKSIFLKIRIARNLKKMKPKTMKFARNLLQDRSIREKFITEVERKLHSIHAQITQITGMDLSTDAMDVSADNHDILQFTCKCGDIVKTKRNGKYKNRVGYIKSKTKCGFRVQIGDASPYFATEHVEQTKGTLSLTMLRAKTFLAWRAQTKQSIHFRNNFEKDWDNREKPEGLQAELKIQSVDHDVNNISIQTALQLAFTSAEAACNTVVDRLRPGWWRMSQNRLTKSCAKRNSLQAAYNKERSKANRFKLRCHQRIHKKLVAAAKRKWIAIQCKSINEKGEVCVGGNWAKEYWKAAHSIADGPDKKRKLAPLVFTDPATGKTATSAKKSGDILEDHLTILFQKIPTVDQEAIDEIPPRKEQVWMKERPDKPEIIVAVKVQKSGKAAGDSGIPAEYYKLVLESEDLLHLLWIIIGRMWKGEEIPKEWLIGRIKMLPKGGNLKDPNRWRSITLLDVASKIMSTILTHRLNKMLKTEGSETQNGFTPGRGTTDGLFTAKMMLQKLREHGKDVWAFFLDLVKAFDTVPRDALMQVLKKFGIPDEMVAVIKRLYTDCIIKLEVETGKGPEDRSIGSTAGVKQGDNLAPVLFKIFIQAVMEGLDKAFEDAGLERPKIIFHTKEDHVIHGRDINTKHKTACFELAEGLYADDALFIFLSRCSMEIAAKIIDRHFKKFGLLIHRAKKKGDKSKTECMYFPHRNLDWGTSTDANPNYLRYKNADKSDVQVDGGFFTFTDKFKYLGSIINWDLEDDEDVARRISQATGAFKLMSHTLRSNKVKIKEKTQIYLAIVCSILLYGSECWSLRAVLLRKLETFHNLCIRRICGISLPMQRKQRISSANLRNRMGINSIEELIMNRTLRWAGHVARMDWLHRAPRFLLTGWVKNKRQVGRPQMNFAHTLKKWLFKRAKQLESLIIPKAKKEKLNGTRNHFVCGGNNDRYFESEREGVDVQRMGYWRNTDPEEDARILREHLARGRRNRREEVDREPEEEDNEGGGTIALEMQGKTMQVSPSTLAGMLRICNDRQQTLEDLSLVLLSTENHVGFGGSWITVAQDRKVWKKYIVNLDKIKRKKRKKVHWYGKQGKQKKKKKKKVSAKDWHCLKKAFYGWGELFNLINIVYGEDHVLIGPTTYIFPVEGFDEPVEIDVEADSEEEEDPAGHEQPNSLWQIANQ